MKNVKLVLNSMIVLASGQIMNPCITTRTLIQVSEYLDLPSNLIIKAQAHI